MVSIETVYVVGRTAPILVKIGLRGWLIWEIGAIAVNVLIPRIAITSTGGKEEESREEGPR